MAKKIRQEVPRDRKERLVNGQVHELQVHSFDGVGCGRSTLAERPVAVSGALPGETVRARITHVGQRTIAAGTVEVITPSPDRVAPHSCPPGCDACPFIPLRYEAQLAWKERLVRGALHAYPSFRQVPVRPILPSPRETGYRTVAKLVVGGTWARPRLGVYRRHSHQVVDLVACPLHHPLINRVVAAVREGIRAVKMPVYHPKSDQGILRYLVVRVAETSNEALAVFVTAERNFNEVHHLAKHLQAAVPEVTVVAQNVNSSDGNVVLGPQDYFLTRRQALEERMGTVRFTISPRSFFQVNPGSAQLIYETVREWAALSGSETVLDLYCGVGGIALFLAPKAREVIGIEAVGSAVADAVVNARLNGIRTCHFREGDAARLLEELRREGRHFDVAVLNPSRKGCEERVLAGVAAGSPEKILYVSCNPVALARDLETLAGLGYRTCEVQPVDMFPQTPHVECVALLVREATAPVVRTDRAAGTPGRRAPAKGR